MDCPNVYNQQNFRPFLKGVESFIINNNNQNYYYTLNNVYRRPDLDPAVQEHIPCILSTMLNKRNSAG